MDNGYSYLWSNGTTSHPLILNTSNLSGSVTITGANGCQISTNYLVPDITPTVSIQNLSGTADYCPPGLGISLLASAQPATTGLTYAYQWLPVNLNSNTVIVRPKRCSKLQLVKSDN